MRFRSLLIALILGALADARADDRPNFVFFITDDVSAEDLGCYGHPLVKTPNLDKLAAGGMRFTNACLTISSCSPSRCSLITGRYPHNTGAAELHTTLPPGQFLFPQSLRDAGYYTVLSGKHHMGPNADPAFEKISKGKGPGKEEDWVQILRDRPKDRPFFAWFASTDAHRAWQINDQAPIYDPAEVPVPPYLVDGPKTRQDLADYYHEVSRTDHFAGEIAAELKRQGIEGNTYFIYTGDNGRPFPRCKTRLYDSGILPPFIVSCPGKIEPAVTDSLVSINVDLAPTILELAGVARDPRMQGVSFGKVLEDPKATVRDAAFAEHNWHVNQAHERMVREGGWLYIRNAWPERQILCVESAPGIPSGDELWEAHDKGALNPDQRDIFLVPRPAEELYNVSKDTNQLRNIAADPQNAETLARLRKLLDRWTEETGDTVPENPTPDRQDAHGKKNPDFKYGEMPGAARDATAITKPGPIRLD
ncbi:MAG: sulfatase [Verrucomicrobiae bacterium]|nr:sulfatase [Verrucomicrobiae bacterium]MCP5541048.1 sulfatase [Akkermansiaceae bacterium]